MVAEGATGPFAGFRNYGVFINDFTEFGSVQEAKTKCAKTKSGCQVTLTLQTQSQTWDQEMAGCTSLQTDNAGLPGVQPWNHEIGHAYLCHFWWAVNPVAQKWFKLIETFNAQTYAWAYDEFYVPDASMGNLKAILNKPFEKNHRLDIINFWRIHFGRIYLRQGPRRR